MPTDISTGLPLLDLAPGSSITVTTGDAAALVTQLNVYAFTPGSEQGDVGVEVLPLFAYGPDAG